MRDQRIPEGLRRGGVRNRKDVTKSYKEDYPSGRTERTNSFRMSRVEEISRKTPLSGYI